MLPPYSSISKKQSHRELEFQHINLGEYNLVLTIFKEIKESEPMFTIAYSLPSALPWPNFSQVSFLPTDSSTLLGPKPDQERKWNMPILSASPGNQLIAGDTFPVRSYWSFLVSPPKILPVCAGPCFTLYKKKSYSVPIWDGHRLLRLEQSPSWNIYFLKSPSL